MIHSESACVLYDSDYINSCRAERPFPLDKIERACVYMSRCARFGLYFTHFDQCEIGETVTLRNAFYYGYECGWKKARDVEVKVVLDKFIYNEHTKKIKEALAQKIKVINHPELERLCKDKYLTWAKFKDMVPETRLIKREFVAEEPLIVKPRFGFEGRGIQLLRPGEKVEVGKNVVVQKFIPSLEKGSRDLRVVLVNGEPGHFYERTGPGFITNVALGGNIRVLKEVPQEVISCVKRIDRKLKLYEPRVYSADFILDSRDQRPYLIELNSKPAMGFSKGTEGEKKSFIEGIVDVMGAVLNS